VRQQTHEDALETLRKFDTVLIVDDSGSMNHQRRWSEVAVLQIFSPISITFDARQGMHSKHLRTWLELMIRMALIYISLIAHVKASVSR
jgi:hypothetical protein